MKDRSALFLATFVVLSCARAVHAAELFGTSHPAPAAVHIYFSGNDQNYKTGNIWRTEAGTNQIETIYTVGYDDGRPMMVNSFNSTLYWTTYCYRRRNSK